MQELVKNYLECIKCHQRKDSSCFGVDNRKKNGKNSICKECVNQGNREKKEKNPEKYAQYQKEYKEKNKQHLKSYGRYRAGLSIDDPNFALKTKEMESLEAKKEKFDKSREKFETEEYLKKRHPAKKIYYEKNKNEINKKSIEKNRNDPQKRIRSAIRNRIKSAVKNQVRRNGGDGIPKTLLALEEILGCPIKFFVRWLERNFQNGMSWENYGFGDDKWNIEHEIPISHFDMLDKEQIKKASHWSNLFPVWQVNNFKKGNKILPVIDFQI